MKYYYLSFLFIFFIGACKPQIKEETKLSTTLFERISPNESGIDFVNTIRENENLNGILYEYLYNGGGVAAGDFNGDQYPDLYFVSNLDDDQLYLNNGNLTFRNSTERSGIIQEKKGFCTGVSVVDINSDGLLDIYVCKSGKYSNPDSRRNLLFINQGIDKEGVPTFKNQAKQYGLDLPHYSTQATFLDYDKDGDLDVFIINHWPKIYEDRLIINLKEKESALQSEVLLRNDNGKFTDVSKGAGLINNGLSYGLGVAVADFNNDTWPDLLVSHDFSQKDHLYLNNQDGTFQESIKRSTKHISFYSMGNDAADINNDGLVDFMTVDMVGESSYDIKTSMSGMNPKQFFFLVDHGFHHQYMFNALQLNQGTVNGVPQFSDIAQFSGVSNTDWSWAPLFFDVDNDGYKDLFVSNGVKKDFRNNDFNSYKNQQFNQFFETHTKRNKVNKEKARSLTMDIVRKMPERKKPNRIYKNLDGTSFEKKLDWMEGIPNASNGAVYVDLDLDGDLDLVLNNTDDPSPIYENTSRSNNNYLNVVLRGDIKNTHALGAKVYVSSNTSNQLVENYTSRGFQSSCISSLHFGLGDQDSVNIKVIWPEGEVSILEKVKANKNILIEKSKTPVLSGVENQNNKVQDWEEDQGLIPFEHRENDYFDFDREGLLPHRMSRFGPALAIGDVNGDGWQDVFVGGALGQAAVLFIQNEKGEFIKQKEFIESEKSEDVDAKFVDLDGDGDLDLYVATGGNEYEIGHKCLNDRIYENKNGRLTLCHWQTPLNGSAGRLRIIDFDKDGDADILVTGRQIPGKYPSPANTYLLENQSQGTIDLKVNYVFENIGMVTDVEWVDIDNDSWEDVVMVGEWMAPIAFKNSKGKFLKEFDLGLSDQTGWYFTVAKGDFNEDGMIDLVVGNNGLNYKYKASSQSPFKIYTNDFDENGDADIVLSYDDNGKQVPVRGRQCSSQEMPYIKKNFKSYDKFASADIEEIYGEEKLENALKYQVNTFASALLMNKGNGTFEFHNLPSEAQYSAINSIIVHDQNNDSHLDLLVAGNWYVSEVETTRNDASYGLLMLGDGQGNFDVLTPKTTGLYMDGDVRDMKMFVTANGNDVILLSRNNDSLKAFVKKQNSYYSMK
ncbi:FG-GAP-like repeat-containing protein [Flammeovirga sp. EKP202]|uniref:FG-GAP-like repeat-containing protein n=1 Tax=Flammeovirga sp. EKP202 TaxID=2770592 RepID=UPI00165FD410|nr:FG-GAP-like repeat-containing protein [Flammeovirga sp. EKP202]MBD0404671.1 VCBS repeat-containing protein [Flammeovirga sp. EKP202]